MTPYEPAFLHTAVGIEFRCLCGNAANRADMLQVFSASAGHVVDCAFNTIHQRGVPDGMLASSGVSPFSERAPWFQSGWCRHLTERNGQV